MKNKLAENLLRFGIKNLNESEIAKLQGLTEQGSDSEFENLGQILNALRLKNGVYELTSGLANVNIFTNKEVATDTLTSKSPSFSGAYAAPLYILRNKINFFFIGRSMTGGPGDGKWTAEPRYKLIFLTI